MITSLSKEIHRAIERHYSSRLSLLTSIVAVAALAFLAAFSVQNAYAKTAALDGRDTCEAAPFNGAWGFTSSQCSVSDVTIETGLTIEINPPVRLVLVPGGAFQIDSGGGIVNNARMDIYGTLTNDGSILNKLGNTIDIPSTDSSGSLVNNGDFYNNGTLSNGGTIDNSGTFSSPGSFINTGSVVNNFGATFNNNSPYSPDFLGGFLGGTMTNSGTFTNKAGAALYNTRGTIENNAAITNNGDVRLSSAGNGGQVNNNNGGIITNSGNLYIDHSGQINNAQGAQIVNNQGAHIANYQGLGLKNAGTIYNSGLMDTGLAPGGNPGIMENLATGVIMNQGTGVLDNSGSIISAGTLDNTGTLKNRNDFSNSGPITNSGQLDNLGKITNDGTILNVLGEGTITNSKTIDNNNLINNFGTITNTDTINNVGTINNNNGATLANSGAINNPGTINNQCGGIFTGNQPTGNAIISQCSTVSIDSVSTTEGDSGTKNLVFTVTRTDDFSNTASVSFATQSDLTQSDSATAGTDYQVTTGSVTFLPTETFKLILVPIIGDTDTEQNERFLVNLANCVGCIIQTGTGIGTITDDDISKMSIDDPVAVTEGNSGTKNIIFTVTRTGGTNSQPSVNYSTQDGSATDANNDYEPTSGTLSFGPTEMSKTISVQVNGDTADEGNESFSISLSGCSGCTITDSAGVGTILNDDVPAPSTVMSISGSSVTEGTTGSTSSIIFQVSRTGNTNVQSSVDYSTQDGTATDADNDYEPISGKLTFGPGKISTQVKVVVNGDTTPEHDETFSMVISGCTGCTINGNSANGKIVDDDTASVFIDGPIQVQEGSSGTQNMVFTVTRIGSTLGSSTVSYATQDGSATDADNDYEPTSGKIMFKPRVGSVQIKVLINGDTIPEINEYFFVKLSNCISCDILDSLHSGEGDIMDDDASFIAIKGSEVVEGNQGTTNLIFTVTRTGIMSGSPSMQYTTQDGTATDADNDYEPISGKLIFKPGFGSAQIKVVVNGDVKPEPDESFSVKLSNCVACIITTPIGTAGGIIKTDETAAVVGITSSAFSVSEGPSGTTKNIVFTVTRSLTITNQASVDYATQDGTATIQDGDYDRTIGTLTFNPGQTSLQVAVPIRGDDKPEPDETFSLGLSRCVGCVIQQSPPSAPGMILNDDVPKVSINDASVTEGNSGSSTLTFTVSRSDKGIPSSVSYSTSDDSASSSTDYQAISNGILNFAANELSKTFTVTAKGDKGIEPDETFNVNLVGCVGCTFSDGVGVGTIVNDDYTSISISASSSSSVQEGSSGTTTTIEFRVTRLDTQLASSVSFSTQGISGSNGATAGSDYEPISGGILTFDPTEFLKIISVVIYGDDVIESNESFRVVLSNCQACSISTSSASGTILNDDYPAPPPPPP